MSRIKVTVDWDAVKADPVEFSRQLLRDPAGNPVIPHPAQEAILRGIKPWTNVVTGRQFGKSRVMGIDATWYGCTHANREIMVAGPSLEQAKIIFNEIEHYFRKPPLSLLVEGKIRSYPFPEIRLKNGTVYKARGANSPQYMRGNRPHRFYGDEWAFVKDYVTTEVVEPAFAVTSSEPDSAMILISTPFGRGIFYDLYQRGMSGEDPNSVSFHYTSFDNPYANRERLYAIRDRVGEGSLLWRTEYLGIFDTDDRAVFPWADIQYMYSDWPFVMPETGEPIFPLRPEPKHRYVQGVDLANLRDYFVASVVDDTDPQNCYLARLDRHQKKGYPFYKSLVRSNYETYHPRTLVDATSLGESVAQDLDDIGAEGYAMSSAAAKWEIVQELARMVSEHRLRIPPKKEIIDEFRYFEYEVTPSKRIKAEASRGHDDIVMSLALAAHLAAVPRHLGLFRAVGAPNMTTRPRPLAQSRVRIRPEDTALPAQLPPPFPFSRPRALPAPAYELPDALFRDEDDDDDDGGEGL